MAATPTSSSDSGFPWGWVLLVVGVVVVAAAALMARQRSRRRTAAGAWRVEVAPLLERARTTRDLLVTSDGVGAAPAGRALEQQVQDCAGRLDAAAAAAPTVDDRRAATTAGEALRGLYFAIEAEQLLRDGRTPTGEQLQAADRGRADHAFELDQALARLESRVRSGEPTSRV